MLSLVLLSGSVSGVVACDDNACVRHSDCRSPLVCVRGQCVEPPQPEGGEGGVPAGDAAALGDGAALVDATVVDDAMAVIDAGSEADAGALDAGSDLDAAFVDAALDAMAPLDAGSVDAMAPLDGAFTDGPSADGPVPDASGGPLDATPSG